MIEFECVHCNTQISIDPDQMISPELICPACDTMIDMPDLPQEMKVKLEEIAESAKMSVEDIDQEVAEAVLDEPASKQATMWREKLAESFQTANQANITDLEEESEDGSSKIESFLEVFLDYFSIRNHEGFIKYHDSVSTLGAYSILAAGLLALVKSGLLASKDSAPSYLIFGLVAAIASVVLAYLAAKFSRSTVAVIRRTELTFYTRDLLYAFGFVFLALIPVLLLLGVYTAISTPANYFYSVACVLLAVVGMHAGILCLSPTVLNSRVEECSTLPGETGIAFIGYMIRVVLLLSGFLLAVAPVLVIVLVFVLFDKNADQATFEQACKGVAVVALAPMISYFVYLGYRIILDLYNTIFTIAKNLSVFINSLYAEDQD